MRDLIRTCHFRPYRRGAGPTFTLRLYDTGRVDWRGSSVLAYELSQRAWRHRTILFSGDDFSHSPLHASDSDDSIAALMGFLTLRPGDTDSEYFSEYTPEQLAFCEEHAETLSSYVSTRYGKW